MSCGRYRAPCIRQGAIGVEKFFEDHATVCELRGYYLQKPLKWHDDRREHYAEEG